MLLNRLTKFVITFCVWSHMCRVIENRTNEHEPSLREPLAQTNQPNIYFSQGYRRAKLVLTRNGSKQGLLNTPAKSICNII